MTQHSPFPDADFVSPTAPSLAVVLEKIRANQGISAIRARDLLSSVTRMAQIIRPDRPLAEIPADPEWCRIRIAKVLPASIGISPKTWANLTSNFAKAFEAAGITKQRFEIKLSGEWATLWERVRGSGQMRLTAGLSRFPRFCQRTDLQPGDVTDDTLAQYAAALRRNELTGAPDIAIYRTVRAWNLAVDCIEGWPKCRLTVPDRRRSYSLPWAAFPISLEADVDCWLAMGSDDDIFSLVGPRHALAPSTVKLRKGSIQRFATALVNAGHPVDSLFDLRSLVQPDLVVTGLKWLLNHSRGKVGGGIGNIAIAVKMAAKHGAGLPPEDLTKLAVYAQRMSETQPGMTAKNRARMDAFKDPATLLKLLHLPETLARQAETVKDPSRRAATFETATAIAILIACPIRFDNLCNLEMDAHFHTIGRGRTQQMFLRIPRAMVKNRVDLNLKMPPVVASMIAQFINVHRPELATTASRFLFTKRSDDAPVDWNTLRRRIVEAIRKNVGVEFTPHNFRHLAALILLSRYPGAYEEVRRLLAHKNGSTAFYHYVGLENDAAHRRFTELLSELVEQGRG